MMDWSSKEETKVTNECPARTDPPPRLISPQRLDAYFENQGSQSSHMCIDVIIFFLLRIRLNWVSCKHDKVLVD